MRKNPAVSHILDFIQDYLYSDVPYKIDYISWDDKHKKATNMGYSKDFLNYLEERDVLERQLKEYGINPAKFKKVWETIINDDKDGPLVRDYLFYGSFTKVGQKYFMDPTTVSRRVKKFLGRFLRALFIG